MSEEIATAAADLAAMQQLRTQIAALESQLGQAHEHIARLEAALRQVAHMKTIVGARAIVADMLGKERQLP